MFDLKGKAVTNHYIFAHSGARFILKLLGEDDSVIRITTYDGKIYSYLDHDKSLFLTSRIFNCAERIANHLYITPVFNPFYRLYLAEIGHFNLPDLLQSSTWQGAFQNTQLTSARVEKDSLVFGFRQMDLKFDYDYQWTPGRGFPHHYRLFTGPGPNGIDEHWDVIESAKVEKADGSSIEIPSRITSNCTHTDDGRFHRASFTIEVDESSIEVFKAPPPEEFFQVPSSMANIIVDEDSGEESGGKFEEGVPASITEKNSTGAA
ncbi:hypothetical protein VSU19_16695 [Verrucomicrobiales bacterium BCK34]|nr:hypothetical protein [Verrucomicrobiales bacterium BCK34]